jgi:hypothetical protein
MGKPSVELCRRHCVPRFSCTATIITADMFESEPGNKSYEHACGYREPRNSIYPSLPNRLQH